MSKLEPSGRVPHHVVLRPSSSGAPRGLRARVAGFGGAAGTISRDRREIGGDCARWRDTMDTRNSSSPALELFRASGEVPAKVGVFRKQSDRRSETRQDGALRVAGDAEAFVGVVG